MLSRQTNEVISELGSSCSSLYSGCSGALRLPVSVASYTWSGRLAMVSAITRTQAYTAETLSLIHISRLDGTGELLQIAIGQRRLGVLRQLRDDHVLKAVSLHI